MGRALDPLDHEDEFRPSVPKSCDASIEVRAGRPLDWLMAAGGGRKPESSYQTSSSFLYAFYLG